MTDEAVKLYECMYIIVPDLADDQVEAAAQEMEEVVTAAGGEIEGHYDWGRRPFAYKIRQWTEGLYRILYFRGTGRVVDEVKHQAQTDERIIRAMVIIAAPDAIYRPSEEAPGAAGEPEEQPETPAEPEPERPAEAED